MAITYPFLGDRSGSPLQWFGRIIEFLPLGQATVEEVVWDGSTWQIVSGGQTQTVEFVGNSYTLGGGGSRHVSWKYRKPLPIAYYEENETIVLVNETFIGHSGILQKKRYTVQFDPNYWMIVPTGLRTSLVDGVLA
jgi:hypothetical protein